MTLSVLVRRRLGLWFPLIAAVVVRTIAQDASTTATTTTTKPECAVPTVVGASVTGCTEGANVPDATACTWAAENGYTCENAGQLACQNGAFSTTPTCNKKCNITSVVGANLSRLAGDTDANSCVEGSILDHGKNCTWATEANHTCDKEGEVSCKNGVFSMTPVCKGKCLVPNVSGANISGTGCTPGQLVTDATVCTWTAIADTGMTCTNVGPALTCTNGAFSLTPVCLGPDSADLLNNAKTLEAEVAKLEGSVRSAEGSVQDLNLFVGSLADNLTAAAKMASETGEMARNNAAAGKAFEAEKHRVDDAMANLSTQVNAAENMSLVVQGSVPKDFDFSKVSKQLAKLQKVNKTFDVLQSSSASGDSLAAMGKQITDFQKKVKDAVDKSLKEVNLTELIENRTVALRTYGRNLFLNESMRLKAKADAQEGDAAEWEKLYSPPQRRKYLRRRSQHGFGCGDCGQP